MSVFVSPFERTKRQFDLTGVSVMIGIPVSRNMHPHVVSSLLSTARELQNRGISYEVNFEVGCSIPHHARTLVADNYLRSDKSLLFWVDSDIVWQAKDFIRLLCLATERKVVGGIYPAKIEPTVFLMRTIGDVQALDDLGCLEIRGMGLGFTVVQRTVMAQLAERAPKVKFESRKSPVPYIFRCDVHQDEEGQSVPRGEDMAFFDDVRALGYKVFLDPSIALKHVGDKAYGGSIMDAMRKV